MNPELQAVQNYRFTDRPNKANSFSKWRRAQNLCENTQHFDHNLMLLQGCVANCVFRKNLKSQEGVVLHSEDVFPALKILCWITTHHIWGRSLRL